VEGRDIKEVSSPALIEKVRTTVTDVPCRAKREWIPLGHYSL
jgi:hypothetical protein